MQPNVNGTGVVKWLDPPQLHLYTGSKKHTETMMEVFQDIDWTELDIHMHEDFGQYYEVFSHPDNPTYNPGQRQKELREKKKKDLAAKKAKTGGKKARPSLTKKAKPSLVKKARPSLARKAKASVAKK